MVFMKAVLTWLIGCKNTIFRVVRNFYWLISVNLFVFLTVYDEKSEKVTKPNKKTARISPCSFFESDKINVALL